MTDRGCDATLSTTSVQWWTNARKPTLVTRACPGGQRSEFNAQRDERAVAGVIPFVGEDRFFWASDFPHADHPPDYLPNLQELVALLPESARAKLLSENVANCYGLGPLES